MENGTKVGFQNGKITLPNGTKKEVILVTGGSGYLGLHLIEALAKGFSSQYDVAYTYQSHPPSPELHQKLPNVHSFQVDLRTGRGLDIISSTLGHVCDLSPLLTTQMFLLYVVESFVILFGKMKTNLGELYINIMYNSQLKSNLLELCIILLQHIVDSQIELLIWCMDWT